MNQLKIDISFNHNDAVKISSDFSYDLDEFEDNGFFQVPMFSFLVNNENLFEEVEVDVPVKLSFKENISEEKFKLKTKCEEMIFKDPSGNDISKNILYFGFDERGYLNDGNKEDSKLEFFMDKVPDDILENNKNLLELNLASDDLPEDVKEWKNNIYTFKPFQKIHLEDDKYLYLWMNHMGLKVNRELKFDYKCVIYKGIELDLKKINISKIVAIINFKKNLAKNLSMKSELLNKK